MNVSRRSFLFGSAAVVLASAELAELLAPRRTIFLPPHGGWPWYGRDCEYKYWVTVPPLLRIGDQVIIRGQLAPADQLLLPGAIADGVYEVTMTPDGRFKLT
jgi:hypothetical protein